jgi:hypothetical protein
VAGRVHDIEAAMPFKSKAQRRKFAELLVKGEISEETYEEWNRSTGAKELPDRVKRGRKKATGKKATRKKAARGKPGRKKAGRKKPTKKLTKSRR